MYIKVRVKAGAKKEALTVVAGGTLELAVKEEAENNQANRRVLELVATHFGVAVERVRIIRGHRSPSKLLAIPDR